MVCRHAVLDRLQHPLHPEHRIEHQFASEIRGRPSGELIHRSAVQFAALGSESNEGEGSDKARSRRPAGPVFTGLARTLQSGIAATE